MELDIEQHFGISETTDAAAIVISEETSHIALAIEGKLLEDLDSEELKKILVEVFVKENEISKEDLEKNKKRINSKKKAKTKEK